MYNKIYGTIRKFLEINSIIAGIIMVALMFFTAIDVILRYLYRPIEGGTEIVVHFIVLVIFLGFAWCALQDAHIKIDVFKKFPVMDHITYIVLTIMFFFMFYVTVKQVILVKEMAITSQILRIPRWIFVCVPAYGFFLTGIATIMLELNFINRRRKEKRDRQLKTLTDKEDTRE